MSALRKIKDWFNDININSVEEVYRYKLTINLTDGEVIECYPNKYHFKYTCCFSEWFLLCNNKSITISNKCYPIHNIKNIEDEVVDTELVCRSDDFVGIFGLTEEDVLENQKKWKHIIDEYKEKK